MDFLFLNHSASVEAIIVFLCLGIIFLFLIYDAYNWLRLKYRELHPRKVQLEESMNESKKENEPETSPITLRSIDEELKKNEAIDTVQSENQAGEDIPTMNLTGDVPESDDSKENKELENINILEAINDSPESLEENIKESGGSNPMNLDIENIEENTLGHGDQALDVPLENSKNQAEIPNTTESSSSEPDVLSLNTQEEVLTEEKPQKEIKKEPKKKSLSPEKKEKVIEMINNAKTLIARGHIDDARTLIVSGLSLEKNNRELNLLMASLYERDHAFEKAEFILKELAESDPDDVEVLTHLATVVAMQRKFEVSYEIYKKILSLAGETEETLYTLTHIASELSLTDDVYSYSKSYLKQFPKNPEILWLYSQSQITKGERRGAIETLIKLKNLTPYNQEIVELISKLVTEDELAGNFGEENL